LRALILVQGVKRHKEKREEKVLTCTLNKNQSFEEGCLPVYYFISN
jgi:hypothetical protein